MDINFSSIEELKKRLMPALKLRKRELRKQNYHLSEEEIWNYFVNNYWRKSIQLSLAKMVDDVLNREINIKKDDLI